MMHKGVAVSALMLAFSAMFVEKLDAVSLREPLNCQGKNQIEDCSLCWGGTCESLSSHMRVSCPKGKDCKRACVCNKDHYLKDNECVHVSECKVQCPANMVFNPCLKKTVTCLTLNGGAKEYSECQHRCECAEGYIFSGVKPQHCIKISECQKQTSST